MIVFPNAKINLGLNVVRRREDGYHDIETVMVATGWTDVLEIVPGKGEGARLTVTGRSVDCPPEKNLVMKAVRGFERATGLRCDVDIYLRKVIPDGAGLGGGSADAAFTLKVLNEMHGSPLDDEGLATTAATIGADCPFFIYNRPMLCTGTGVEMQPIAVDLRGLTCVIVKPGCSVPTAVAYSRVTPHAPAHDLRETIAAGVSEWRGRLVNDFEPSVTVVLGEVAEIKERLKALGAVYASMSGSGSAVYGLFDRDILAESVREKFAGCDIFAGKMA